MQFQHKVVFLFNTTQMKKTLTIFIIVLVQMSLHGQGSNDAFNFSQFGYQGTAKALSMGNALGAVGGDMTAICINPASMGLYRSSEFAMTFNILGNINASNYYGSKKYGNRMRFSIPNINFISVSQHSNFMPLRYVQFGIGLTRINDYNLHLSALGLNPTSSKIDDYLNQINGFAPDELNDFFGYTAYPAQATHLITIDDEGNYTSPIPQGGIQQRFIQDFNGRSEEWTLGYSMNFNDRLYVGMSTGFPFIKRTGYSVIEETLPEDSEIDTDFKKWSFTENVSTLGLGINFKIGLIWQAANWMRLGASVHTPTAYAMEESWQTETESNLTWTTAKNISPKSNYEYTFISPMRCTGSMAFVINEAGIISFDADYTHYGIARFSDDEYDYNNINQEIRKKYKPSFNFRIGTEWSVYSSYMRFGIGYYGSPYGLDKPDSSVKKASFGLSLPIDSSASFDFGYELSHGKRQFALYDAGDLGIEDVTQSQWRSIVIATLKTRF